MDDDIKETLFTASLPYVASSSSRLLDQLYISLGERLTGGGDRRRLLKAAALVKRLRGAAQLNANPGQMAGWLCAGMFLEHEKGGMQNDGVPAEPGRSIPAFGGTLLFGARGGNEEMLSPIFYLLSPIS